MNEILITKDYKITSDDRCWAIQQYVGIDKKSGDPKWKAITWHGTFDQAVKSLCERLYRAGNCRTLSELREHAESVRIALSRAQENLSEVV